MPVDLGLVVGGLIAEQLTAPREPVGIAGRLDELPLVVVADLVAEVTEHRAVRLVELAAQALAIRRVALGEVDRDHPVVVADRDAAVRAGEQVEAQSVHRIAAGGGILPDHRESEGVELHDEVPLGPLGHREIARRRPHRRRSGACA